MSTFNSAVPGQKSESMQIHFKPYQDHQLIMHQWEGDNVTIYSDDEYKEKYKYKDKDMWSSKKNVLI